MRGMGGPKNTEFSWIFTSPFILLFQHGISISNSPGTPHKPPSQKKIWPQISERGRKTNKQNPWPKKQNLEYKTLKNKSMPNQFVVQKTNPHSRKKKPHSSINLTHTQNVTRRSSSYFSLITITPNGHHVSPYQASPQSPKTLWYQVYTRYNCLWDKCHLSS